MKESFITNHKQDRMVQEELREYAKLTQERLEALQTAEKEIERLKEAIIKSDNDHVEEVKKLRNVIQATEDLSKRWKAHHDEQKDNKELAQCLCVSFVMVCAVLWGIFFITFDCYINASRTLTSIQAEHDHYLTGLKDGTLVYGVAGNGSFVLPKRSELILPSDIGWFKVSSEKIDSAFTMDSNGKVSYLKFADSNQVRAGAIFFDSGVIGINPVPKVPEPSPTLIEGAVYVDSTLQLYRYEDYYGINDTLVIDRNLSKKPEFQTAVKLFNDTLENTPKLKKAMRTYPQLCENWMKSK